MDDALNAPYFQVSLDLDATPPAVAASGELDAASTGSLRTAVDDALAAGRGLDLQLGEVTFIDSSALRVITVALRHASESAQPFTVSSASDAVRRIFEITGVSSLLDA